jgi:hypothetical protein
MCRNRYFYIKAVPHTRVEAGYSKWDVQRTLSLCTDLQPRDKLPPIFFYVATWRFSFSGLRYLRCKLQCCWFCAFVVQCLYPINKLHITQCTAYAVEQSVEALRYKAEGRGFDSQCTRREEGEGREPRVARHTVMNYGTGWQNRTL